ncbi:MAG: PAS domain-containing protein [Sphingomicrobium sp.]
MNGQPSPDDYLKAACDAVATENARQHILDGLPVPVYMTDADGNVTYWNRACVDFAGREPVLGRDKWCVTWRILTTAGEHLPHDQCPMATAIQQRRQVRDAVAIAERPDGSRVAFRPYPTPLFADDGSLKGAINMLIDISAEQATALSEQAALCRRLAKATYDRQTSSALGAMANGFERTAEELAAKPS